MLQAEMARADSHFGKSLLALSFPWQFNTKEENESFTRENCTGASLHSCPSSCGQQCKDYNIKQTNGQIYVSDIQHTRSDRSNPSQKASMQKASLRASSQPQSTGSGSTLTKSWTRAMGSLKQARQQRPFQLCLLCCKTGPSPQVPETTILTLISPR